MNTVSAPSSDLLLQHLASLQFLVNENGIILDASVNGPSSSLQPEELIGRPLSELVGDDSRGQLESRLDEARNTLDRLTREARSVTTTVDGMINTDAGLELNIAITYLRQSGEGRLLIRLRDDSERDLTGAEFQSFFSDAPDGILELDEQGIVLTANDAFLEMAGIVSPELAEGRRADRWIGRSAVDLNIVLDHSKQEGSVRLYSTTLRTETESSVDIELSVARVGKNGATRVMLFVRDIGRRITPDQAVDDHLPRSIEQITGRVGRVPLKELGRESTDVIEALCIEAALKLTSGNRASAAELLGLSRQSLYTKLRRFDLGDAEVDGDRDAL